MGFLQTSMCRHNRPAGVGSPCVSGSNTGDWMMTDVSESGPSLLQYLPTSLGDQRHMKGSQLGSKLKGRAQALKGASSCGRWPVAPFSCTTQTSLNPYTCNPGMFHPAAQLVCWTQSLEHVVGDKPSNARARKEKTTQKMWRLSTAQCGSKLPRSTR